MRWNKLPNRGLQLRMTIAFASMAAFAAVFQVFLIQRALVSTSSALPNDGQFVLERLPDALTSGLFWTLSIMIPVMLGIGVLITFRVAGPVWRMQRYLDDLADGSPKEPCRLRTGDDMHELCDAINRAVETIHGPFDEQTEPAPSEPNPVHSGFAIITALITIIVLSSTIVTAVMSFQSHSRQVERRGEDYELESAVESVSGFAMHELWSDFKGEVAGGMETNTVEGFRRFLDGMGALDQSSAGTPAKFDVLPFLGLDFDADGTEEISNVPIDELSIVRVDDTSSTDVRVTATVSGRARRALGPNITGWQRSIETTYTVEPDNFGGLEFALLANNVNCILCHAKFDSVERVYGGSGPHERVKIGSLEHLSMRLDPDSEILGTLYVGGAITDSFGHSIPPSDWTTRSLTATEMNTRGEVVEDAGGQPVSRPLTPSNGSVDEYGNFYEDYRSTTMIDGELPDSFPAPFPDDGGVDPITEDPTPTIGNDNRVVDDNEYYAAVRDFTGSISGGQISVLPPGDKITSAADLAVAINGAPGTTLNGSDTEGTVFLTGTESNPILLNGSVAIDGNLVIRGYVKGKGQIWVRENVYAPTDVEYLDGDSGGRTYGFAADTTENMLAVTAGGNVLIGNVMDENSSFGTASFVEMEIAIFNRSEWVKTQPTLPDASGSPITNNAFVPGYIPRYYAMTNGEPIGFFNHSTKGHFAADGTWLGLEKPNSWDATWLNFADPGDPADPYLYHTDGSPKAVVKYVTGADWIDDTVLADFLVDEGDARTPGELKIDMFTYTNNAIFGVTSIHQGNTGGRLRINGGVVAADVGLLATQGLELNYDKRVLDVLRIQGDAAVTVRRSLSVILR